MDYCGKDITLTLTRTLLLVGQSRRVRLPPTVLTENVIAYAYTEFSLDIYKHNEKVN